jgi:hypothetical protein
MEDLSICKCCYQQVIEIRSFDEVYAEALVIWDKEANDIAEEYLYEVDNKPALNSWESFKVYKLLAENIKSQIKRFYEVH